jgi:diadenosine tetraphosphate (Ap4A) HIT family hydrolase
MTTPFELHDKLAADTIVVGDLVLCRVLVMNDQRFPWVILVPKRAAITEVFDLTPDDQRLLWAEVTAVAAQMKQLFAARKMNIAAIGNRVAQLHVHIIARHDDDSAWPGVVWDKGQAPPMTEQEKARRLHLLANLFNR